MSARAVRVAAVLLAAAALAALTGGCGDSHLLSVKIPQTGATRTSGARWSVVETLDLQ